MSNVKYLPGFRRSVISFSSGCVKQPTRSGRCYASPKRRYLFTSHHGITPQKTQIFSRTAVRTSNQVRVFRIFVRSVCSYRWLAVSTIRGPTVNKSWDQWRNTSENISMWSGTASFWKNTKLHPGQLPDHEHSGCSGFHRWCMCKR